MTSRTNMFRPIDLSKASGGRYFTSWYQDHSIILHRGTIWIPGRDFDGAILVDACASSARRAGGRRTRAGETGEGARFGAGRGRGDRN
jgi:hypothetical protein